jgi:hypothetical protein
VGYRRAPANESLVVRAAPHSYHRNSFAATSR